MYNFKIFFLKENQEIEITSNEYDNCFPLKFFIKNNEMIKVYNTKLDELYRLCMNKKYNDKFKEIKIEVGDHYKLLNLNNKGIEIEILKSMDFLNELNNM